MVLSASAQAAVAKNLGNQESTREEQFCEQSLIWVRERCLFTKWQSLDPNERLPIALEILNKNKITELPLPMRFDVFLCVAEDTPALVGFFRYQMLMMGQQLIVASHPEKSGLDTCKCS